MEIGDRVIYDLTEGLAGKLGQGEAADWLPLCQRYFQRNHWKGRIIRLSDELALVDWDIPFTSAVQLCVESTCLLKAIDPCHGCGTEIRADDVWCLKCDNDPEVQDRVPREGGRE